MAQSREWQDWHLTPNGWVGGSYKGDGGGEEIPPPLGLVLTQRYVEKISYGSIDGDVKDPSFGDINSKLVQDLIAKFGPCPDSL